MNGARDGLTFGGHMGPLTGSFVGRYSMIPKSCRLFGLDYADKTKS